MAGNAGSGPGNRLIQASVEKPQRLDIYLKHAASISRQRARKMIDSGLVSVNGESSLKHHKLIHTGDNVSYPVEQRQKAEIRPSEARPDVIYESPGLIAVNKPAGMLAHPTKFHEPDTLVNAVMAAYPGRSVHVINRLDRDTSGTVLVALEPKTAAMVSNQVMKRRVYKEYACLVHGRITKPGRIEVSISEGGHGAKKREVVAEGGLSTQTTYEPVKVFEAATLLKVVIRTGRTHQIRAHMQFIKHPVAGDQTYGDKKADEKLFGAAAPKRQLLHASVMTFSMPGSTEVISIKAPLPEDFSTALRGLGYS